MKILVTGANGQLGNEMRIVAKDSQDEYIFTDVVEVEGVETTLLDITSMEAVRKMVQENDVKCIINCAAYTNVDKAETDEAFCELLNAKAVENLAVAMKEVDGVLVHISTDYVFGGNCINTPIKEDATTNPLGVYGQTKLMGEEEIVKSGCKYFIIRTAWLYSAYGNNFVKTILRLSKGKESLNVVCDQVGTPTYAGDLALVIKMIAESDFRHKQGVYHFSNEGAISWFDFAKKIGEYYVYRNGKTDHNRVHCGYGGERTS